MIIGIGTDIVEVQRIQEKMLHHGGFMEMVFSPLETIYCMSQKFPEQHFAARFAAKESLLKATAKGLLLNIALSKIEIDNNADGQPHFVFAKDAHDIISHQLGTTAWKSHLSLSHTPAMASAFVILETL